MTMETPRSCPICKEAVDHETVEYQRTEEGTLEPFRVTTVYFCGTKLRTVDGEKKTLASCNTVAW